MQGKKATVTMVPQTEGIQPLRFAPGVISDALNQFISKNLLLTFDEAGNILRVSTATIAKLVKDGFLVAADRYGKLTNGSRITAESLLSYRKSIIIPSEKFSE